MAAPVSALEFFLVTLIEKAELRTVYELHRELGLSPGALRPALENLVKRGYLEKSEAGSRGRQEFVLTGKGEEILSVHWQGFLQQPPEGDADSVVRVAWALNVLNARASIDFLESAAAARERMARASSREAESFREKEDQLVAVYRWMRAVARAEQYRADAKCFTQLARRLERRGRGKRPAGEID